MSGKVEVEIVFLIVLYLTNNKPKDTASKENAPNSVCTFPDMAALCIKRFKLVKRFLHITAFGN